MRKGKQAPLRTRPVPPPIEHPDEDPDILIHDWRKVVTPRHPTHSSFCSMAWSCFGSLYDNQEHLRSSVPKFLAHAAWLMTTYDVDLLWLNDARFTKDTLERHLHLLRAALPDCRVIQFPTTRVQTGSRCEQNNQMGGAIAIVNYKWKSFVVEGSQYTDPMGLGLINSIDFRLDDYKFRSVNVYFMCSSVNTGYATLHSRTQRYQHQANIAPALKRLTTQQFLENLTQSRISPARLAGWLVMVQGDFNRPLQYKTVPTDLETWMDNNQLTSPDFIHLQHLKGYHTRNSGGGTQIETGIDHSMHTPLPTDVLLEEVGVVNSERRKEYSDHLPV